ncbi:hypothetical protein JCM6882_006233 [Rhodosporidiobolus microsporus]
MAASSTAATDVLPAPVQDAVPLSTATTATTSTSSARPDAHTQRYDRQLRLWASAGQTALENARVLVVGANGTATQTLKNLVLPGIGHFSLLSPVTSTTPSDLGTNFFLSPSSLSQPLAPSAVAHLLELNSDVSGTPLVADVSTLTAEQVAEFSLVVLVDVEPPREAARVAELAWERGVPLIKVVTAGFFGLIRTQVEELCFAETHPESLVDLRVHAPFPALLEYANSFVYDQLDNAQHGHVPAVVILVKALEEWKAAHNGASPTGTAERRAFTDAVLKQKRQSDEENFDEAVTLFRRAGTKANVPPEVEALFNDPACENVNASSSNFWLLLHSLRTFVRSSSSSSGAGLLPLSGALPDMKSSSSSYVALQQLYKTKAREDRDEVRRLLRELCARLGVEEDRVKEEEVESFVKHAAWVKVVRGRSLKEEEAEGRSRLKGKTGALLSAASFQSPPDRSLYIYLALVSSTHFHATHGRYPGSVDSATPEELEKDAQELEGIARGVMEGWKGGEGWAEYGVEEEEVWKTVGEVCREVTRAPPSTALPQTSALLGGLVAQEAIKLITKQYVPLGTSVAPGGGRVGGETAVWDGVRSGTGVLDA